MVSDASHRMKDCTDACIGIIKLIIFSSKQEIMLENMKMTGIIVAKSHRELRDDLEDCTLLRLKKFSSMH